MNLNIHITSNTDPLSQFVVRDDFGSYDNEYMDQLMAVRHTEALQAAGKQLVRTVATQTLNLAKKAGNALVDGLDTYISTGQ